MMGIGPMIKAIAMLLIVIILAAGGWYVMNLKADLAVSEMNAKTLQDGIAEQQAVMAKMQEDIKTIQETNTKLQNLTEEQKREVDTLSRKFSQDAKGQPRDFGALAAERPDLVERLVNRGTKNAMRCLEIASGAPRTEAEINAKTSSEINKECPAIANPNYKAPQ
jgi:biopolymer transport protein ExbB/TolQ